MSDPNFPFPPLTFSTSSITMSDATYHTTRQDLRKAETKATQSHGGTNPSNSDVSQMKVRIIQRFYQNSR